MLMSTGMATTGVADIGNDITEPDTTFAKLPHCRRMFMNKHKRSREEEIL